MRKILFYLMIFIIIVLIWYKIPYKIEKNYLASTVDGTTVELSIKMKAYRNFISPTDYRGSIAVNNEAYKTIKVERENKLIGRISMKIRGEQYYLVLRSAADGGRLDQFIYVLQNSSKFNKLHFMLNDKQFFAPAKNAMEAIQLQKEGIK